MLKALGEQVPTSICFLHWHCSKLDKCHHTSSMHVTAVSNSLSLLKEALVVWLWDSGGVSIEKKKWLGCGGDEHNGDICYK
eukprot:822992-Ditylum_brightwellii.AAC.1